MPALRDAEFVSDFGGQSGARMRQLSRLVNRAGEGRGAGTQIAGGGRRTGDSIAIF